MQTENTQTIKSPKDGKTDFQFYTLELVERKAEYANIHTFRFKPIEPLEFRAGQWVHLGFPMGNRDKTFIRHMSFASSPKDELLDFTMDLASVSPYKQRMAALQPGDQLKAFKIKGEFHSAINSESEVVFLTGGIGVTPVRSVLRELQHLGSKLNWTLCHVSRDKFLYEEELTAYRNQQWRTNREGLETVWPQLISKPAGTRYFISGSDRFVRGMVDRLIAEGKLPEDIITESFH
ncbi:FAD-dependent oxidoreductase [Mangrovibacterium diazotrophicum]|uniref:Ferredoxin-NADP reductase n=1 Tax=Mangrovibacterium diazotrophicum TaxID=1261403 RepID=A0A419VW31_9BACT|nr:FAD-dependent oxidoreductase [Mangrovibacterium diazotrophicum]RKD86364.1 ferredoxin-NADP reductase [Mangrovibacterium diazotrophicum]